jgi:hypothetical protein
MNRPYWTAARRAGKRGRDTHLPPSPYPLAGEGRGKGEGLLPSAILAIGVIASEAKQSIQPAVPLLDCFVAPLLAMTS